MIDSACIRRGAITPLLALILICSQADNLHAQWRKVLTFPKPDRVQTIYFNPWIADHSVGFVSSSSDDFYRTTDGGKSWDPILLGLSAIWDISFSSSSEGLASVAGGNTVNFAKTTDGGSIWVRAGGPLLQVHVHGILRFNGAIVIGSSKGVKISKDEGITWTTLAPGSFADAESLNPLCALVSSQGDNPHPFLLSTDGGATWNDTQRELGDGWTILPLIKSQTYLICNEPGPNATTDGGQIVVSRDSGRSFEVLRKQPFSLDKEIFTGGMSGDECAVYIQTYKSVWVSHDQGVHWTNLGGPGNHYDTRFWARDGLVFAGDEQGNVWSYRDTTYSREDVNLDIDGVDLDIPTQEWKVDFGTVSSCDTLERSRLLPLKNPLFCEDLKISYSWLKPNACFTLARKPPQLLRADGADSMSIRYRPLGYGDSVGILRLTMEAKGQRRDTTIRIKVIRPAPGDSRSHLLSTRDIIFPEISTCYELDTTISFRNVGCFPLRIDSLALSSNVFSLEGGVTNRWLPVDSVVNFRVHFHPSSANQFGAYLTLYLLENGAPITDRIALSGKGLNGDASLMTTAATPVLTFDDRSTCGFGDSLFVTLFNTGCDTLKLVTITEVTQGSPDLIFSSKSSALLVGSDSVSLAWHLNPAVPGAFRSEVRVRYQLPDGTVHDTVFSVSANVVPGSKTLAMSASDVDFGAGTLCREFDTAFVYTNTGCEPLEISSLSLTGIGYTLTSGNRAQLRAGESDTIRIHYTPQSAGVEVGTLRLETNADQNPKRVINFRAENSAPESFRLSPNLSANTLPSGGETTLQIFPDKVVAGRGLRKLEYDLLYDTDLLTATSSSATVSDIQGGKHVVITGSDLSLDPAAAISSINFRASVSRSSSTSITVSGIRLNDGEPEYQRCALSASVAGSQSFTLSLSCGDETIRNYLNKKVPFRIVSLRPNPANDHILITIEQHEAGELRYEIQSMTGEKVQSGAMTNSISTAALPNGEYYLRVSRGGFVQTEKIVVVR